MLERKVLGVTEGRQQMQTADFLISEKVTGHSS